MSESRTTPEGTAWHRSINFRPTVGLDRVARRKMKWLGPMAYERDAHLCGIQVPSSGNSVRSDTTQENDQCPACMISKRRRSRASRYGSPSSKASSASSSTSPAVEDSLTSTQVCVPYTTTTMGSVFSAFPAISSVPRNPEVMRKFLNSRAQNMMLTFPCFPR